MLDTPHRKRDEIPGGETHPEPVDVKDEERPAVKEPDEARAAYPVHGGIMRRVMVISIAIVVVAFAVIYLVFS
jgi:hypothetical protein